MRRLRRNSILLEQRGISVVWLYLNRARAAIIAHVAGEFFLRAVRDNDGSAFWEVLPFIFFFRRGRAFCLNWFFPHRRFETETEFEKRGEREMFYLLSCFV